ncbi:MAG: hypothetical protein SF028_10465 [Candidatus Sumerlaeia bacterium]|nr:hypothetical protein [Candidatus Sumerlaeia bacterium]
MRRLAWLAVLGFVPLSVLAYLARIAYTPSGINARIAAAPKASAEAEPPGLAGLPMLQASALPDREQAGTGDPPPSPPPYEPFLAAHVWWRRTCLYIPLDGGRGTCFEPESPYRGVTESFFAERTRDREDQERLADLAAASPGESADVSEWPPQDDLAYLFDLGTDDAGQEHKIETFDPVSDADLLAGIGKLKATDPTVLFTESQRILAASDPPPIDDRDGAYAVSQKAESAFMLGVIVQFLRQKDDHARLLEEIRGFHGALLHRAASQRDELDLSSVLGFALMRIEGMANMGFLNAEEAVALTRELVPLRLSEADRRAWKNEFLLRYAKAHANRIRREGLGPEDAGRLREFFAGGALAKASRFVAAQALATDLERFAIARRTGEERWAELLGLRMRAVSLAVNADFNPDSGEIVVDTFSYPAGVFEQLEGNQVLWLAEEDRDDYWHRWRLIDTIVRAHLYEHRNREGSFPDDPLSVLPADALREARELGLEWAAIRWVEGRWFGPDGSRIDPVAAGKPRVPLLILCVDIPKGEVKGISGSPAPANPPRDPVAIILGQLADNPLEPLLCRIREAEGAGR